MDSIWYVLQPPDVEGLATLEKSVLQDFYRKYYEILKEALVEAGFPESSVKQRWHFLELSVVIDVPPAPSVELEEQDWD